MDFFTSDTHFGHVNIIPYCNRPFASVQEMNEALIARWNDRVGASDTVYHLGDRVYRSDSGLAIALAHIPPDHDEVRPREGRLLRANSFPEVKTDVMFCGHIHGPLAAGDVLHAGQFPAG